MPLWARRSQERPDDDLWLVTGLGNPGKQYANTRHNLGFMVVDILAQRHGMTFKKSRQRAEIARGHIGEVPVLLALPLTYMNQSGDAVSRLRDYYTIPIDRLLVVCDDLDLPFGTMRLRPRGSSGGNGGLRSIIEALGTEEFARLRVGVGRPTNGAVGHVLSGLPPEQERLLASLLQTAADAVEAAVHDGVTAAMNRFNRDWLPTLSS